MMKLKKIKAALVMLAFASVFPMGAMAQSKDPVKVGLVSSKSGVFAEQGEEVMRAIKFAIEEADDEGNPEAGRRVAEKLARDGYNLLIGAIPSSISLAIAQNLDRWDAAYFVVASKSDKITGDTCKPRSFRTNHADNMDIAMINQWAKNLTGKTYAVMAADYVWGRDSGESFKKAAESIGKSVPLTLYAPLGTKDFSPYIAQLKAANVDAIWVAETGRDAIAFVKQAEEFGLIPKTKLLGHSLILNFMINGTGKALEGTVGTTGYTPDIDNPRNKAFVAAWRAKFNRLPTDNEGQAYNGAQVIFEGVKLAKSVKPEEVSKALPGSQIDSIYGSVSMRAADNQLLLPNYIGRAKVADGALRPVIEQTFPPSIIPAPSPLCKM
jgi:branched-chain amino acid transport system substrate-binding protein